jgi:hypothetical protein
MANTLDQLFEMLDGAVRGTLQQAGELGVKTAQQTNLFHAGRNFQNQIITFPTSSGQTVWSQAPYSQYLEYGNNQAGSRIYPKNKKALHFISGGHDVFVKWVRSHGPLPYMHNARIEVERQLPSIWQHQLKLHLK